MKLVHKILKMTLLAIMLNVIIAQGQVTNPLVTQTINRPLTGQVMQLAFPTRTEKGANAFNSKFEISATGKSNTNAYLLSFLATAVYPDGVLWLENLSKSPAQSEQAQNQLQVDTTAFMAKFRKVVSPYFSSTTQYNGANMRYFAPSGSYDGYDPEAVIIPTSNAIYVTIRGTDRVAQNNNINSAGYGIREWLQTDFQALPLFNPPLASTNGRVNTFVGRVHQGFWLSISKIAESMATYIKDNGGANKKVWITAHSLGAGQAQLFAYYLAKVHNIKAQGVYGFAAPLVGTADFYRDFETVLGGKEKLQRFEFVDDPITAFALIVPGISTGGTRVHYDYIKRENYAARERDMGEILRICASAPLGAADIIKLPSLGGMCYHWQHWYMQAAYQQLTDAEKANLPNSLSVPNSSYEGCTSGLDINRATVENPIGEAILDLTDAALKVISDALAENGRKLSTGLKNFFGSALKNGEGKYRIKCLKGGRYLNVSGNCFTRNNCAVMLWGTTASQNNELFNISKYGFGYGIKVEAPNTEKVLDVTDMSTANNAAIQTYDKHLPIVAPAPNNQIWYFLQIGSTNRYIIQNERSGKVLEADDANTGNAGCGVRQNPYRDRALNQIWVLEKVN